MMFLPPHARRPKRVVESPRTQPRRLKVAEPPLRPVPGLEAMLRPAVTLASLDRGYAACAPLAQDAALPAGASGSAGLWNPAIAGASGAQAFIGYPMCANLAQYGLMQAGVGILADEATRKWPEFSGAGNADAAEAAKRLNEEMDRLRVRERFHQMARMCGFFGGGLLYIDRDASPEELNKPFAYTGRFVRQGSVRRLVPVEPWCVSPVEYESTNPLREDYFRVTRWYVSGVGPVHASHFLHFVKTLPPVLLRPAYNFFGVPDVQMALDYFLHFTETRESAARLLKKFSLTILKSDVDQLLYGGDESDVRRRIGHLAQERDNDGVYVVNFENEDIVQVNTPLSGVTDIVRQALELLACVWRYPVVKFLGVSPGGMNATGESDMRSFYDHVASQRQLMFGEPFERLFALMQLNLFGAERGDVTWAWPGLWEMTDKEKAELEKAKADTDAVYLDRGTLDSEEVRASLATDPDSRYCGIDPADVPEQPDAFPPEDPFAGPSPESPAAGTQPPVEPPQPKGWEVAK